MKFLQNFGFEVGTLSLLAQKHAMQLDAFRSVSIKRVSEFNHYLKNLTFIDQRAFGLCFEGPEVVQQFEEVELGNILGASGARSWWLCDKCYKPDDNKEYVWNMAHKLKNSELLFQPGEASDIYLNAIGGSYFVTAGRHRVAALKGMGLDDKVISAYVLRRNKNLKVRCSASTKDVQVIDKKLVFSDSLLQEPCCLNNELAHFEDRRRRGLWEGEIEHFSCGSSPGSTQSQLTVLWKITSISLPWVFAYDFKKSEELYRKTNPDFLNS